MGEEDRGKTSKTRDGFRIPDFEFRSGFGWGREMVQGVQRTFWSRIGAALNDAPGWIKKVGLVFGIVSGVGTFVSYLGLILEAPLGLGPVHWVLLLPVSIFQGLSAWASPSSFGTCFGTCTIGIVGHVSDEFARKCRSLAALGMTQILR